MALMRDVHAFASQKLLHSPQELLILWSHTLVAAIVSDTSKSLLQLILIAILRPV